jgi:hypothetical protein
MDFDRLFASIDDADAVRKQSLSDEQARLELGHDPLFYEGRDPVTGKVRTQLGVVRSLSNVQPEMGQSGIGVGGFDVGSRRSQPVIKPSVMADIKILATCVSNGRRRVYLGGDRPSTREILDVAVSEQIGQVVFQYKGAGIGDWTLGIGTYDSGGNYRIYTVFGDGTPTWSIQDQKTQGLVYYGEGFWSALLRPPLELKDENYANEQFLDYQGTQVKAFVITPDGPGSAAAVTVDSGFVANLSFWEFTGTKTRTYETSATREIDGNGTVLIGRDIQARTRVIETQCPTFRAYDGALTYNFGSYRYESFNQTQTLYSQYPLAPPSVPPIYPSYLLPALPDPNLPNWLETQTLLSIDTTLAIAPMLNKRITLEYPGVTGYNVNFAGDLTQYYPVAVFGAKTIYRSLIGLGRSLDDTIVGATTKFFLAGVRDVEVLFPQGLPQTFIDSDTPLPTARSIDTGSVSAEAALTSRLSCNILTLTPLGPTYDFTNAQTKSVRAFRVALPSDAEARVLGIY